MNGAEALTYLKRRLREAGANVEDAAERDAELYEYLSEGRDWVRQAFVLAAPVVVRELVTLEVDGSDARIYSLPEDTSDPLRALLVRSVTSREELHPSSQLDQDAGEYEWISVRSLRLAQNVNPRGGVEAYLVTHRSTVSEATEDSLAAWGIPQPCHRAAAKAAAVLALTANEVSTAGAAAALFRAELDRLERIYGEFDGNGGHALREALMLSAGTLHGDQLW